MYGDLSELVAAYVAGVGCSFALCLFVSFISWVVFYLVSFFQDASRV